MCIRQTQLRVLFLSQKYAKNLFKVFIVVHVTHNCPIYILLFFQCHAMDATLNSALSTTALSLGKTMLSNRKKLDKGLAHLPADATEDVLKLAENIPAEVC